MRLSDNFAQRRVSFHVATMRAIERSAPNMHLRGSFRYGDFHLDRAGMTFSDIDLLLPCLEKERHLIASRVEDDICKLVGQRVKVSVQHRDTQGLLSLDDARFLAAGDYLRQRFAVSEADGPGRSSYLLGKAVLGVLRHHPSERGSQVAAREPFAVVTQALEARLGFRDDFGEEHAAQALMHHPESHRAMQLAEWLSLPGGDALEVFREELGTHNRIDPWLRALFNRLTESALANFEARSKSLGVQ